MSARRQPTPIAQRDLFVASSTMAIHMMAQLELCPAPHPRMLSCCCGRNPHGNPHEGAPSSYAPRPHPRTRILYTSFFKDVPKSRCDAAPMEHPAASQDKRSASTCSAANPNAGFSSNINLHL